MVKMISAIVLTQNNQDLIKDCLESLGWVDEIIIIDSGSIDKTLEIAKIFTAKVYSLKEKNFSELRNFGAKQAEGKWLLYVDSDEVITTELKKEIQSTVDSQQSAISNCSAFAIPRKNILLGHPMRFGGWWPDYVLRLMKKESLIKWKGELHEQPKIKGEIGKLTKPLLHNSHRTLSEMVEKTNEWSEIEARLLFRAGHPKVVWWRFITVAFREFMFRGIINLGFLDGPIGIIEIIYQMYSRMITYAKLWELQIKDEKN